MTLNALSPAALEAAMRGGTAGWAEHASAADHVRYAEPADARSRLRCHCGCGSRATHRGMANGICLMTGCELEVRRWVRNGRGSIRRRTVADWLTPDHHAVLSILGAMEGWTDAAGVQTRCSADSAGKTLSVRSVSGILRWLTELGVAERQDPQQAGRRRWRITDAGRSAVPSP